MNILRFPNQSSAKEFIKSKLEQTLTIEESSFIEKIIKLSSYGSNRLLDESYFVDTNVLYNCIKIISKK